VLVEHNPGRERYVGGGLVLEMDLLWRDGERNRYRHVGYVLECEAYTSAAGRYNLDNEVAVANEVKYTG
jgi:hypothetical protein